MELLSVRLDVPEGGNVIVGQTHFIKSVEDLYEAMVNTVPQMKFGIAFNEASGPCLTRVDGNDEGLKALAARMRATISAASSPSNDGRSARRRSSPKKSPARSMASVTPSV